jgi:hypothetical protein
MVNKNGGHGNKPTQVGTSSACTMITYKQKKKRAMYNDKSVKVCISKAHSTPSSKVRLAEGQWQKGSSARKVH